MFYLNGWPFGKYWTKKKDNITCHFMQTKITFFFLTNKLYLKAKYNSSCDIKANQLRLKRQVSFKKLMNFLEYILWIRKSIKMYFVVTLKGNMLFLHSKSNIIIINVNILI